MTLRIKKIEGLYNMGVLQLALLLGTLLSFGIWYYFRVRNEKGPNEPNEETNEETPSIDELDRGNVEDIFAARKLLSKDDFRKWSFGGVSTGSAEADFYLDATSDKLYAMTDSEFRNYFEMSAEETLKFNAEFRKLWWDSGHEELRDLSELGLMSWEEARYRFSRAEVKEWFTAIQVDIYDGTNKEEDIKRFSAELFEHVYGATGNTEFWDKYSSKKEELEPKHRMGALHRTVESDSIGYDNYIRSVLKRK